MSDEAPLSDEAELDKLARLLSDPEAAAACLPQEEHEHYERCQRSVVEARRYAEAHAHEHYVW